MLLVKTFSFIPDEINVDDLVKACEFYNKFILFSEHPDLVSYIKECNFFQASMIFLGHVFSAGITSDNHAMVDKVRAWIVPKNAKEVYTFLGLRSQYCWFIPNFAHMAKGLD